MRLKRGMLLLRVYALYDQMLYIAIKKLKVINFLGVYSSLFEFFLL